MPTMPLPNVTTADQLLVLHDPGWRHELWSGALRRMRFADAAHGDVAARICAAVFHHVDEERLGCTFATGTGFAIARDPDTVLAPDVAFVQRDRLPPKGHHGFFPGPPDLAVEVISPDELSSHVASKVAAWLSHGSQEVWVVDLQRCTLAVHRDGAATRILRQGDRLRDSIVLPGFTLELAELFDD